MLSHIQRFARPFALLLALSGVPASARDAIRPSTPWLYRGSDIPVDRAWVFGELPNGVRYAVRKNGVPPGQVSIRVAIDAGSLSETPAQKGYAHYMEHLSFRGSRYVPDGEAKRLWQRLGATFGSDTNAATTPTQTIYKLDLPAATPAGLAESVKVLSGMMAGPQITQAQVEAERRTVLAELREGAGPGQRVGDATRELFFAGQALGRGSPIGDSVSLQAATAVGLRAFHDRWYRPERTTIVIVGDVEPATLEALIKQHFGDWRGVGPAPTDPDFGKPIATADRARVVVEPGVPMVASLAVMRPWLPKADTIEYNRGKLIEALALRLISRRLEQRARAGGSFLSADVGQDDVARSVDGTFIQIVPLGDDWRAAIRDVRAVIADALSRPSAQADIDREAAEFAAGLQVSVERGRGQSSGDLADQLVEAVNIRETVASPEVARDVFSNMKARLTPAAILAATKRMLSGTPMRALLTMPTAMPGAEAALFAAVSEDVRPGAAQVAGKPVSIERLPKFGTPGTVVERGKVGDLGLEFLTFSNSVRAQIFPSTTEAGRVYVSVRFGRGQQALPTNRRTVAWAGDAALVASGLGDLNQDDLDRLTSGRALNMDFDIADDAFVLRATTRDADLADQLRLIAAKLAAPAWDPAPIARIKAATLKSFATIDASPGAVMQRELRGALHGGDPRWAAPERADIEALTPASFRALFEPLLASGPIEVAVYGDTSSEKAIAAVAATFGAMPPRPAAPIASAGSASVTARPRPLVKTHTGPTDQAAAALAWPTAGGGDEVYESRKLDVLAAIFNDRMFDQLREGEGASYSPNVSSSWPFAMPGGGSFVVASQVKPGGTDRFFTLARTIAADLAAKPPSADELLRAVGPMKQAIARASSSNGFWLSQLTGATTDQRRLAALSSLTGDYTRITAEELQASAKRWLVPDKSFAIAVVPRG